MRRALVFALAAMGCGKHLNPDWCAQPGHSDPACRDAVDAMAMSTSCVGDDGCPGSVCLPEGTCADPASVLYASSMGAGTACTSVARCSLATAIGQATPSRGVVALDPGIYRGAVAIDRPVRLLGHHATLQGAAAGDTVTVTSNGTVELDDLSITGASAGNGISCASGTLIAHVVVVSHNLLGVTSACALRLDRSIVFENSNGALAVTAGAIDVRNNFIVNNGNPMLGRTANVTIAAGVTGSFAFNTVAYNDAKVNGNPGIDCNSAAVTGDGNIVTDNTHKGAFNVDPQVSGACDFTRSYTAPGAGGNDLAWVNVATSDFHLTSASTAVLDSPTLTCSGRDDVDGEARPLGKGCDYGADELAP